MSLRRTAIGCLAFNIILLISSSAAAIPFSVTTEAVIEMYSGPVGAPINEGPAVDPAYGPSIFEFDSTTLLVEPTAPYAGYSDAEFEAAGTADVVLNTSTVTFRNTLDDPNTLSLVGTTTQNVDIGQPFHIATISFLNGDWFSSSPEVDQGNGPLYPLSTFRFTVTALTDTPTGSEPHVWTDTLILVSTRGAGTPDNLFVQNSPFLGGIAISEGAVGIVEVWGRLGSLEPLEFRNPSGGAALIAAVVPEPVTLQLMVLGLVSLAVRRARRSSERRA